MHSKLHQFNVESTHLLPFPIEMNPQIQNQESLLKESIKHFLTSYDCGSTDFSPFESIFFRLIQTMLDPPLEITWFYSAVTFHAAKLSPRNNRSNKVLIAKDLLNLLISCSNLSSASKKIALLAPVLYDLYSVVCDTRKSEMCEKMEVCKLVENVVSYVMMSAGVYDYGNEDVECDNVVVCFEHLIRVWTTDRGGGSCNFGETLKIFFPLLTDGTRKGMNARTGIRQLVGIVLCEVFFLRLYLSINSGMCKEDNLKSTRDEAVETIKGFRNRHFLDLLLNMLLEPSLPIAASLSPADAVLLQKALYDAVILIDYTFYSGRWVQPDVRHSKKLALVWVLAAHHAIEFARATADEERVASYLDAFRESQLVAELIKWVHGQAGMVDQNAIPEITTPIALTHWLLILQDQGIAVFDSTMAVLHDKAVACIFNLESDSSSYEETIDLNIPDAVEDQEMHDPTNNESPGGLCLMSSNTDGGRKRKEALSGVGGPRVKQLKLDVSGDSGDGTHRERVVIDISSEDDDMET